MFSPILLHQVAEIIDRWRFLKPVCKFIFCFLRKLVQFYHTLLHLLGYTSEDFVYLVSWNGGELLHKWQVIQRNGLPIKVEQSMHQIGLTRHYVVLMDTAFKIGPEQLIPNPVPDKPHLETEIRDILDNPQSPKTVIHLVRRSDLKPDRKTVVAKKVVITREIAHFLTNYDDAEGTEITLHAGHNSAWDPSEWLHDYDNLGNGNFPVGHRLVGMAVGTTDLNFLGRYTINPETGKATGQPIGDPNYTWSPAIYAESSIVPTPKYKHIYWNCWGVWEELTTEFICKLYQSYRYRKIPIQEFLKLAREGKPANICHLDTEKMAIVDSYHFPPGYFGNSPQFVPRSQEVGSSTDDGYLICTVLYGGSATANSDYGDSEIWIFDAANLSQGPICKLGDPTKKVKIGLTIHSTWLPTIAKRTAKYNIPVREDYDYLIEQQDCHLREQINNLFQDAIYPHFLNSPHP